MELIRPQAMQGRQVELLGSADLTRTRLAWPVTLLGAVFVLVLCGFVMIAEFSRVQKVSGQLIPSSGVVAVLASENGVVTRLLVSEGDRVSAGQPLAELSSDRHSAEPDSPSFSTLVDSALARQKTQLLADLQRLDQGNEQQRSAFESQLRLLKQRLQLNQSQLTLKTEQHRHALELWERLQGLQSGALSALQLQQHRTAVLVAESDLNSVSLQRLDIEREIATVQQQLRALPLATAEATSAIEQSLSELEQSQARNRVAASQVVRAPGDGVIASSYTAAGQSIVAGQPLFRMMPEDSALVAELWVPSEAIGTLNRGDEVVMRYRSFPYRRFGLQYGVIESLSGTALQPAEVEAASGLTYDSAMYRVRVRLARQTVLGRSDEYPLRSGMYVDADLLLEKRPLLPFYRPGQRADTKPSEQLASVVPAEAG